MSSHLSWCLFTHRSRFWSAENERSQLLFHCAGLVHAWKPLRFGSRDCGSHFWAIGTGFSFCSWIVFELWAFKDVELSESIFRSHCWFYWVQKDHLYVIDPFCNRSWTQNDYNSRCFSFKRFERGVPYWNSESSVESETWLVWSSTYRICLPRHSTILLSFFALDAEPIKFP